MIITKDEYNRLGEIHDTMAKAMERINEYKPFSEDPTELINLLTEALEHLDGEIKMLAKVNYMLKKEGLRP